MKLLPSLFLAVTLPALAGCGSLLASLEVDTIEDEPTERTMAQQFAQAVHHHGVQLHYPRLPGCVHPDLDILWADERGQPAVAAIGQRHDRHVPFMPRLYRAQQAVRSAAAINAEQHVAGLPQGPHLARENVIEPACAGDGGNPGTVATEGEGG